MEPDETLIRQSLDDPPLFEDLVDRHSVALHAYLARRVPESADDLLSETWLEAYRSRARYDAALGSVRGWLFGIARNVLHVHLRKRRIEVPSTHGDTDHPWDAVDARIDAARHTASLMGALGLLPAPTRELFLLVALEGLTPSEAAATLGIRATTARSQLHRARRDLQAALGSPQTPHTLNGASA